MKCVRKQRLQVISSEFLSSVSQHIKNLECAVPVPEVEKRWSLLRMFYRHSSLSRLHECRIRHFFESSSSLTTLTRVRDLNLHTYTLTI